MNSYNQTDSPPSYENVRHQSQQSIFDNEYNSNDANSNISKDDRLREIINKHEISTFYSKKLQMLSTFKTIFLFDDSGSMNTTLNESPLNTAFFKATRWDELQFFARISLDLANIFNENGSDVYFLNRATIRNVKSVDQLKTHFQARPSGFTPLSRVLRSILADNYNSIYNQNLKTLIVIITDGEPTDDNGKVDIKEFKRALKDRPSNVYTTIVSATDDDTTMAYLDNWDASIGRLDVVDDFRNERAQILRVQGRQFRFTFGDYVVKSMIGSIDLSIDRKDETANNCSIT